MLISMTGFGDAHFQEGGLVVAVEVRSINNRYFKASIRSSEGYGSLEPRIEAFVRGKIRRGTVNVSLRVRRDVSADDYRINPVVLSSYCRQLSEISTELNADSSSTAQAVPAEALLSLPGVVEENRGKKADAESDWPIIESTLKEAIKNLTKMRQDEGAAMEVDLRENCQKIAGDLDEIETRAPIIIESYRQRLIDRLNKLLNTHDVTVAPADVVREVGTFAERTDIAEEIVRLRSHLDQFATLMDASESSGRKIEFLIQEMFREANTIGSKANDAEIARRVVEIKTAIERLREQIQNCE